MIPGYEQSVLGFNLSNGGNGTTFSTMIGLVNGVLPQAFQPGSSQSVYNLAWITTTATLYTIILGTVWTRARSLSPVDVALLGLLAWLIPLKIVYTHYLVWAIIPFLMRGRLKQTILVSGLAELANTLAYWTSTPGIGPIPGLDTFYGPVLTSVIMRLVGAGALAFVLNSLRKNPPGLLPNPALMTQTALSTNAPQG
jgi:hypothetical protein